MTEQEALDPEPEGRLHCCGLSNAGLIVTCPVGVMAVPTSTSVTVAVQVTCWPTVIWMGMQETLTDVARLFSVITFAETPVFTGDALSVPFTDKDQRPVGSFPVGMYSPSH